MTKKVLLVSAMQNDFFTDDGALPSKMENVEKFKNDVANFVKDFDGYIFFSKYETFPESVLFNSIPKHCLVGTPGAELINEIGSILNQKCEEDPSFIPYIYNSRELINASLCTTVSNVCEGTELHIIGFSLNGNILDNLIQIVNDASYRRNYLPKVIIHSDLFFDTNKDLFNMYVLTKLAPYFNVSVV